MPACTVQGDVSQHALGRGCVSQHALGKEGVCPVGICLPGVSAKGVSGWGCGRQPPWTRDRHHFPPLPWTEWQTGVKTLPCRNLVVGGKNGQIFKFRVFCHRPKLDHYLSGGPVPRISGKVRDGSSFVTGNLSYYFHLFEIWKSLCLISQFFVVRSHYDGKYRIALAFMKCE